MSAQYTRAEYIGIGQKIGMLFEKAGVDLAEIRKAVEHPAYMPQMIRLLMEINHTHGLPEGRLEQIARDCKNTLDPAGHLCASVTWQKISRFILDGSAIRQLPKRELIYTILLYQDTLDPSNEQLKQMINLYPWSAGEDQRREIHYAIFRQAKSLYGDSQYSLGVSLQDTRSVRQVAASGEIDLRTAEILEGNYIYYLAEVSTWSRRRLLKLSDIGPKRCKAIQQAAKAAGYDLASD